MKYGLLTATALAAGLCASNASAQETWAIAASMDLSGAAADVGKDVLDGAQYAVDLINEKGGVLGKKLELKVLDNGSSPQTSIDQATRLVQEGAVFILSPASSSSALAVSKSVSSQFKVPVCVSSSGSDDLTIKEFQPYVFTTGINGYMESQAVARRLAEMPHKRYGIVSADYAGGRSVAARFAEFIQKFNPDAEIVVEEYPKFGATDYTASINKLLAAEPDYVYTVLFGADLITFAKQAQSIGFFEEIDNNFTALYDGNTLKALGSNAPIGSDGYQRAPFNEFAKTPEGKAYVDDFNAKVGRNPSDWATASHDCIMAWAAAAGSAGTTDGDAVMKEIETGTFTSPRGELKFGAFDHQGEVPSYIGKVAFSDEFGQPVLEIEQILPGADLRPEEAAVKAMRERK